MKTAQEWLIQLKHHQNNTSEKEDIDLIAAIQLDAYKAGILLAAEAVDKGLSPIAGNIIRDMTNNITSCPPF